MLWQKFIWNTYNKSYMVFSWPDNLWSWMTFTYQIKYNWVFNGLYLLNDACYDQSLHETHIVSHIYMVIQLTSWSLTLKDLWHWMTFKGHIEVIECLVGCISWIVHVIIWLCVNNEHIWLPGNYGRFWAIFESTSTGPNFTLGHIFTWTGTNNDHIWLPIG